MRASIRASVGRYRQFVSLLMFGESCLYRTVPTVILYSERRVSVPVMDGTASALHIYIFDVVVPCLIFVVLLDLHFD